MSSLASYDFDIVYRPGTSNIDADILSRHPSIETQPIISEFVRAVCGSLVSPVSPKVPMSVDILGVTEFPGQPMAQVDMRELQKQQNADSRVGFWLRAVRDKRKPDGSQIHSREDSCLLKSFDNFRVVRGHLYRDVISENELKHHPRTPDYTLYSGVHVCWSEHSDSSFIYGLFEFGLRLRYHDRNYLVLPSSYIEQVFFF